MSTSPSGPARIRYSDLPPRDAPLPPPRAESADTALADMRSQTVLRMTTMNVLHSQLAWRQRRRDPLAAYALAFLFRSPDPRRPHRHAAGAATRLWLAGPETEHLPQLLFTLDRHASELLNAGHVIDIRTALANRTDQMPEHAEYVGVAVSNLDTHTGTWSQVCQRSAGEQDIPGRMLIALTDGTLISCQRRGLNEFNDFHATSNRSLEIAPGRTLIPCSWATTEELRDDDTDKAVWRFLGQLGDTLCRIDNARLSAAFGRHQEGSRGR